MTKNRQIFINENMRMNRMGILKVNGYPRLGWVDIDHVSRKSGIFFPISARNNYLCRVGNPFYAGKSWNLYQRKYTPKLMVCQKEP